MRGVKELSHAAMTAVRFCFCLIVRRGVPVLCEAERAVISDHSDKGSRSAGTS